MANEAEQGCDTLFYDGGCPICRREVTQLRRQAKPNLAFVDIQTADLTAQDRERLLQRLHLRTEDGRWLTGLEANVQAWQHTRYAALSRWLLARPIRPVAELAYSLWLKVYQWRRKRRTGTSSRGVIS